MHNQKYKTLLNNTFLLGLGTFGSKLLTFLMVRFYTGVLSPSDYGTADLIMQTANLLIPIASLGITNGVFRFALDRVSQRKTVFTGGLITIVLGSAVLLLACPLLSYSSSLKEYAVLICAYTLASNLHSLCAQYVRAQGKTGLFALQGILNTALVIFFNILFLLFFRLGVLGYVMSVVAADGLCTLYLVLHEKLWTVCTPDPEKPLWKSMLRYSIPLIPTTIFWWITSVSDRYMIAYFLGTEANGLYAVACKIPTVLTLLSTIFLEAWQFSAIEEATGDREVHIRFYGQVWSAFLSAMVMAGSVLIVQEDIWGNRNILSKTGPGQTFAEVFACAPGAVLNVSVEAESAVTVMFLHIRRVLSVCPSACSHHSRIIRNLLDELAEKNLRLNEKLTHMAQRTTRAKLMSYFSAEAQRRSVYEFDIPFSRQQLADYLGVERSGLSVELGKMRDEGLLDFHKSHFLLKTPETDRPFPSAR